MQITVYSLSQCPQCVSTKNLLRFSQVDFKEVMVERGDDQFNRFVSEGVRTFPVVEVLKSGERDRWTGYNVDKISSLVA